MAASCTNQVYRIKIKKIIFFGKFNLAVRSDAVNTCNTLLYFLISKWNRNRFAFYVIYSEILFRISLKVYFKE